MNLVELFSSQSLMMVCECLPYLTLPEIARLASTCREINLIIDHNKHQTDKQTHLKRVAASQYLEKWQTLSPEEIDAQLGKDVQLVRDLGFVWRGDFLKD